MKIDQSKLIRQEQGIDKWVNSSQYGAPFNGCGCLNYVTGFGKTFTALNIMERMIDKNSETSIFILVPTTPLHEQWKSEIVKYFKRVWKTDYIKRIFISTVQKVQRDQIPYRCTLLIVDELHYFYSEERIRIIDKTLIQYNYILGLTATYEDYLQDRHKKIRAICPIVDTVDRATAVSNGWVADSTEYNFGIQMSDENVEEYKTINSNVKAAMQFFDGNYYTGQNCITGTAGRSPYECALQFAKKKGYHRGLDPSDPQEASILAKYNPNNIITKAVEMSKAINARKQFLYKCEDKLPYIEAILNSMPNFKAICFSQSTDFADALFEKLGKNNCSIYHSNLEAYPVPNADGTYTKYKSGQRKGQVKLMGKKKFLEFQLQQFLDGKKKWMVAAAALDAGMDDREIRLSVIASGTSSPSQYDQRYGRVIRRMKDTNNDEVIVVNLYLKDTKEEDWLKSRQRNALVKAEEINQVNQIKYANLNT